jgi:hypothetical protein
MKAWDHPLMTWLPGPALAVAGAAVVRWLAPGFTGRTQAILIVVGYLVIPLGLYLFAAGLGRRAAQRSAAASAPAPRS